MDLAVGVVIGTAFNKIVDSLVNDIVMQAIAAAFKQPDFSSIAWHVNGGAIKFGAFINNIVNFLVVAVSVFVAIKFINRLSHLHFADMKMKFPFKHQHGTEYSDNPEASTPTPTAENKTPQA